jgi:hypothetical protein
MPTFKFDLSSAPPDLQLGSLNLFVIDREYPDSAWLVAAAYCSHPESYVSPQGPFMRVGEIEHFLQGCEAMQTTQHALAQLYCIEQSVLVDLSYGGDGLNLKYQICPYGRDNQEEHTYKETFERSELPRIILACRRLLGRFPRGDSSEIESSEFDAADPPVGSIVLH